MSSDVLNDDYANKFTLKCKKNAGPVAITIESEQAKSGGIVSKIGTKFSYGKFNVDKGQLKADGYPLLESSLKATPDIKLSFKTTKGADLGIDYTQKNFYATGAIDVLNLSKINTSACYTLDSGVKVGADATYGISGKTGLTGFNVGASYSTGPLFCSLTTSKFSTFNLGLVYNVNSELSVASQTSHSGSNIFDVVALGVAYKTKDIGTVKAKVGMNGIVHASLIRDIAPKVTLTASAAMSCTDPSTFKPGLGISM